MTDVTLIDERFEHYRDTVREKPGFREPVFWALLEVYYDERDPTQSVGSTTLAINHEGECLGTFCALWDQLDDWSSIEDGDVITLTGQQLNFALQVLNPVAKAHPENRHKNFSAIRRLHNGCNGRLSLFQGERRIKKPALMVFFSRSALVAFELQVQLREPAH